MRKEYFVVDKNPEGKNILVNCRILKKADVRIGDPVKVISGKKIPLGTEGSVTKIYTNGFSHNVDENPRIEFDTGKELLWTTGNNLVVKRKGLSEMKEFDNTFEALDFCQSFKEKPLQC